LLAASPSGVGLVDAVSFGENTDPQAISFWPPVPNSFSVTGVMVNGTPVSSLMCVRCGSRFPPAMMGCLPTSVVVEGPEFALQLLLKVCREMVNSA
jgi:hypothetical protein